KANRKVQGETGARSGQETIEHDASGVLRRLPPRRASATNRSSRRLMSIFTQIARPSFATRPKESGPELPTPFRGRAIRRRQVMFREAKELLPYLPNEPGDATHCIMNGRYDLMVLLVAILEHLGGT